MSKVSKGFVWSFIERFSMQGISFFISIILARIIAPESYGLIVMIQVFLTLSQVFIDSGFANALIQKQDRTEDDYNTAFLFNFGVATLIYFCLFVASPFIASFYNEPRLELVTRVISLNLIFSSLSIVQKTRLTIALDFKTQAKAGVIGVCTSGFVGILCAYNGFEVWALVIQALLNQLICTLALMAYSKWLPKFQFSIHSFRQLFGFGSKLLLTNLATSIYLNIYNLAIGKKYTSADLAYYNRAFTLTQFPSANVVNIMNRIIYPLECETQSNKAGLRDTYYKYLHLTNLLILPLMCILFVCAKPVISILLTDKWIETVPFMQVFCINFMMYAWLDQSVMVLNAVGKSGVNLKAQIIKRCVSFAILLATISFGVIYICIGIAFSTFIETLISIYYVKKELGFGIIEQIKTTIDVFICNAIIAVIAYIVCCRIENNYLFIFTCCLIWTVLYIIAIFAFKMSERSYILKFISKG